MRAAFTGDFFSDSHGSGSSSILTDGDASRFMAFLFDRTLIEEFKCFRSLFFFDDLTLSLGYSWILRLSVRSDYEVLLLIMTGAAFLFLFSFLLLLLFSEVLGSTNAAAAFF